MPFTSMDLYWIPLGAGNRLVQFNGKVYEAIAAAVQRRPRLDVYHTALTITLPEGCYAIEMTPIPNRRPWERGVVAEGSVGAPWAGHLRIFRYEVRRWLDGVIPDLDLSVMHVHLGDNHLVARAILDVLPLVPTEVWGRDRLHAGEMWSCNSIISWALARAGVDADAIALPDHGRAPGWHAGITVARRREHPTRAAA